MASEKSLLKRYGLENDDDGSIRRYQAISRGTISEMIWDSNGLDVKTIKDGLIRWKKCFEDELNG